MMPDISKFTDRDLLVMTVQKVSGLEEKVNSVVERMEDHDKRIRNLENNQAKAEGSVSFGKWLLASLGPLGTLAGWLVGRST